LRRFLLLWEQRRPSLRRSSRGCTPMMNAFTVGASIIAAA